MAIVSLKNKQAFWAMEPNEVSNILSANLDNGLTLDEVKNRLLAYGKNAYQNEKKATRLKIFLNQLKTPLILILIVAGIVTFAISHYRDSVFIFIAVIVNSFLGYWQENKAEKALSEIKRYLKQRSRVVRDGVEKEIDAEDVVPGDVIKLSQGDRVPADARVLFVNDFQVDESILTGESLPVIKTITKTAENAGVSDQGSMVFAGTLVTQGLATALVCRTASSTELGKIASLIAKSENERTPLQNAISRFSILLSILLGVLTIGVFAIGIASGRQPLEMFLTSVALAVSAIPEGLPISMTVILAVGVERMAKRKGVVRKLVAAEALGSATIILTDKTGTLTMAKMAMSKIVTFGVDEDTLLNHALSNVSVVIENPHDAPEAWRMNGKIMETALARSSAMHGVALTRITDKSHVLEVFPFNPVQKFSATLINEKGRFYIIHFGAADILLGHSALTESEKEKIHSELNALTSAGERVLGVAVKEITDVKNFSFKHGHVPQDLVFEGLIAFRDPVRPGVKEAVARVTGAGIKTVIMTGDHKGTALAVAREVGLKVTAKSVLEADTLVGLSDSAIKKLLPKILVISRVTPLDKLRIVRLYQELGESVAMTGDGVNDAPSIKQADIGIAMGSGTEVAQSVADLVLLDDNFETIVSAIEEGRQILGNLRKVLVYLLSNVADGLILIGGSIIFGVPLPLNALQILWVNFFSDSFPAIAFAFEKDENGLLHEPAGKKLKLFNPLMRFLVLVIGVSTSALLFVIYLVLLHLGFDPVLVRTFIFASFGTYTLFMALSVRSLDKNIFYYSFFSNKYMAGGIGVGVLLMALAVYLPPLQALFGTVALPFVWVIGVFLIGAFNIILIEISKKLYSLRKK